MKNVVIFLSACFISLSVLAQKAENEQLTTSFIFPDFVKGTVEQKAGTVASAMMNYNSVSQEMIFEEEGKRLAMLTAPVIAVYMENRKFIPVGKVFYEILTDTEIPLFVQHATKAVEGGKPSGYGSTSQTTNIDSGMGIIPKGVQNSRTGGSYTQPMQSLKLPEGYKVIDESKFWVKKDNRFYQINNTKDVINIFPQKGNVIKDFVAINKIKFAQIEDVKKLILFCNNHGQ